MWREAPRVTACLGLLALGASGCAVATAAMKSQIDSQCRSVGVKGCPDVADGVIAFADGKDAEGENKLRSAAAQNSPEQLRKLTKVLEPILEAADADTAKKLRPVITILNGDADTSVSSSDPPKKSVDPVVAKATSAPPLAAKHETPPPPRLTTTTTSRSELDNLRAGMVNPTTENQLLPCDTSTSDGRPCGRVRVLLGPFVLTNLYTAGGCARELFVTSTDSKVAWTMLAVAGDRLNVSGRFPIDEGQSLYVGTRGNASAKDVKDDLRCAIVWSGFRPTEQHVVGRRFDLGVE